MRVFHPASLVACENKRLNLRRSIHEPFIKARESNSDTVFRKCKEQIPLENELIIFVLTEESSYHPRRKNVKEG